MAAPTISISTTGSDPEIATIEELESDVNGALTALYNKIIEAGVVDLDSPSAGSGNDWSASIPSAFSGYEEVLGSRIMISAPTTNTGSVTLDLGTTNGAVIVRDTKGEALVGSELQSGVRYIMRFSGSVGSYHWRIISSVGLADWQETFASLGDVEDYRILKQFGQGDGAPNFVELSAEGHAFRETDEFGNTTIKSPHLGQKAFAADDLGDVSFETDEQGNVTFETDTNGGVSSPGARLFPIPYVSGSNIKVVDGVVAPIRAGETVLNSVPFSSKSVRAIIDRSGLYDTTSLSGSKGMGVLIPDDNTVLHIIIINGQSLSVGAQAGDSLFTVWSEYPDDALMFDGDSTIDVRMGLPSLSSEVTVLDTDDLTDFQPFVAKLGQGSGNRGETLGEGISRQLVAKARSIGVQHRTLWVAPGLGGTAYSGLAQGTTPYANMIASVTRAKELAEAKGWKVVVDCQIIAHGEGDASNSGYYDDLLEWQSDANVDIKAITGQIGDIPFLMQQPSSFYGSTSSTESIKAMLKAHELSDQHFLIGPSYQAGDLYASDILHFTGPGYRILGETAGPCVENVLWGGRDWDCVRIKTANRSGNVVTLTYNVPVGPLEIDTSLVTERDTKGYRYFDDAGEIAISSVSVTDVGNDGTGTVELTLGSTPSGTGERAEYAFNGHSGTRVTSGIPRGNLRDSAGDTRSSTYDNTPLHNWGVHQSKEVTVT